MPKEGPLWGQPSASTRPRWLRSILATNRWHARRYGHAMVIRRGHFFAQQKWWSWWWFQDFLFSPLPGQSDPTWRIEFCTWVELVQPPTSGDFSVCPANLSWIPFVKDSPFGLNIFGTSWWRRSLVRELWRHHLLKSCWFCCSYIPLQYTCQIFTICDFFCLSMHAFLHPSIYSNPSSYPIHHSQGFSLQFNSVVPCCTSQPVILALEIIIFTHRWLPSQPQLLDWQRHLCGNFSEKAPGFVDKINGTQELPNCQNFSNW